MKLKILNIILLFLLTSQVCLSQGGNQELPEKYYLTELRGNISLDMEITDLKSNKGMINVLISDESKNDSYLSFSQALDQKLVDVSEVNEKGFFGKLCTEESRWSLQ